LLYSHYMLRGKYQIKFGSMNFDIWHITFLVCNLVEYQKFLVSTRFAKP